MSKLVFSTVAKEIKNAMSEKMSDPDLIRSLYDIVAKPADLPCRRSGGIPVDKKTASNIMNRKSGGNVLTDIQNFAYENEVIEALDETVQKNILSNTSEESAKRLVRKLRELIENDTSMEAEKREELLSYAKNDTAAKFIGHTLLCSFKVPNVAEADVIKGSFLDRITKFQKGTVRRAQKDTCTKLARLLSKTETQKWLLERIAAIKNSDAELEKKCRKLFRNDKQKMPPELAAKIDGKFNNKEDIEALMLLILWAIFGDNISMLSFLYAEEKKETPVIQATESRLLPHPVSATKHYIGHEKLIDDIHSRLLQGNHFVFLQGMGGIGKTETSKKYAEVYKNDYDTVIFAEFNSSLTALFNDNNIFTFTKPFISERLINIDGTPETDEEFYQRKLTALRCTLNDRTLIILDNVDVQEDKLPDLLNGLCHIIVTTRWDYQAIYCDETIQVDEICDMQEGKEIFAEYYGKPVDDDEYVEKIIDYFSGHILALELAAKQMKASGLTAEEMYERLSGHSEEELEEGFIVPNKSRNSLSMTRHIRQIFNMTKLSETQKYILCCMALMPKSGLSRRNVRDFCELKNYSELNKLVQLSWLRENDDMITMHPLINETVQINFRPDLNSCWEFIMQIIKLIPTAYCYHAEMDEKNRIYNIASHLFESFPEPETEAGDFYEWTELVYSHCDQPEKALSLAYDLYSLYRKELGDTNYRTIRMLCRIACDEQQNNHNEIAMKYLEQGHEALIQLPDKNTSEWIYISDVDRRLPDFYFASYKKTKDDAFLSKAEKLCREMIDIRHRFRSICIENMKHCMIAHINLSLIALYRNDLTETERWLQAAEEEVNKYGKEDDLYFLFLGKAELAIAQKRTNDAISYLEQALKFRSKYFAKGLGDPASNIVDVKKRLTKLYENSDNIKRAAELCQEILDTIRPFPFYQTEYQALSAYLDELKQKANR